MGTGTSPGHGQGHGPHSQFVNTQGHYPNIATPTSAPSYPYSSSTYTTMSSGCPGFASNHQIPTSQPCQVSQSHPPVWSLPMQPSTQTAYAYPYMLQHQQVPFKWPHSTMHQYLPRCYTMVQCHPLAHCYLGNVNHTFRRQTCIHHHNINMSYRHQLFTKVTTLHHNNSIQ